MATIIKDTFSGETDGTRLASHVIAPTNTAGASWSENGGIWAVHSSPAAAYQFSANLSQPATVDALNADVTITCDLILGGTAASTLAGLAFRLTGTGDYWFAWIRGDTNKLELYDRAGSANNLVDDDPYTVPTSTTATMTATLNGTSISVTIGSATVGATSSTRQTATKHGLMTLESSDLTKWDNYQIDSAGGGGVGAIGGCYFFNARNLYPNR